MPAARPRSPSSTCASSSIGTAAPAVTDLTLDVAEGEIVALVGPSGCGKTTTLKMINRLVEPTSGTIRVLGEDQRALPAHELRRRIGYVIQQIGLFPHRIGAPQHRGRPRAARVGQGADPCPLRRARRPGGARPRPARSLPRRPVRRATATRRRGAGARRRSTDPPDGRAVQRGRPDRAGKAAGRSPHVAGRLSARRSWSSPTTSTRRSSSPTGWRS